MAHTQRRQFQAVLKHDGCGLGWTVAEVPFAPRSVWPGMVRLRVRGCLRGAAGDVSFRSSLFPSPGGGSLLVLVTRAMQRSAGVQLGDRAEFTLEPDLETRPAELPDELDALLDEAEGLRTWYLSLSEALRREIGKWIGGVKSQEARLRRSQQTAERLLSAMEAEVELPPIIERAFRERARARLGWSLMTPAQRRRELMAVFYYQSPEARERRVAKLVASAEQRSDRVG